MASARGGLATATSIAVDRATSTVDVGGCGSENGDGRMLTTADGDGAGVIASASVTVAFVEAAGTAIETVDARERATVNGSEWVGLVTVSIVTSTRDGAAATTAVRAIGTTVGGCGNGVPAGNHARCGAAGRDRLAR